MTELCKLDILTEGLVDQPHSSCLCHIMEALETFEHAKHGSKTIFGDTI